MILGRVEGMKYEDFVADRLLFGGIVYHTMIIGEAAYKLSQEFRESHAQTDWQSIADMRHHLVHGYYQVDPSIVWSVVQNELSPLLEQVKQYLAETNWEEWEKQESQTKN